ncbi:MAG: glycosyltransferase [Chlorobi bacterium]|nr:glycosyltransferase [Chlorobiota bacterium]
MEINIYFWALTASALLYLTVILLITIGWFKIQTVIQDDNITDVKISLIVAVRNEEKNILNLLNDIAGQNYPFENLEILIVDDHSEDKTTEIIRQFEKANPALNITMLESVSEGKKAAIATGIKKAKGELIVTTDGDCRVGPLWLGRMVNTFKKQEFKLIMAPVVYQNEKGFLQQFFSLDFMSLVAVGAGSVGLGLPFMGNGANLAFERKAWEGVIEDASGKQFASGDDVFLVQAIAAKYGASAVVFLKDPSALVLTNAPESFKDFLSQRIRWASKAKGYRMPWAVLTSFAVLLFNLFLVSAFFAIIFRPWFFIIFSLFVLLKMMTDYPLLKNFSSFVKKDKILSWFFIFEFIYPFYILISALAGLFFKFKWKGRSGLR